MTWVTPRRRPAQPDHKALTCGARHSGEVVTVLPGGDKTDGGKYSTGKTMVIKKNIPTICDPFIPAWCLHFYGNDASRHGWRILAFFSRNTRTEWKKEHVGSGPVQGPSWAFVAVAPESLYWLLPAPSFSVWDANLLKACFFSSLLQNRKATIWKGSIQGWQISNFQEILQARQAKMAEQQMNPIPTGMFYEHHTSWSRCCRPARERKPKTILVIGHKITVCQA